MDEVDATRSTRLVRVPPRQLQAPSSGQGPMNRLATAGLNAQLPVSQVPVQPRKGANLRLYVRSAVIQFGAPFSEEQSCASGCCCQSTASLSSSGVGAAVLVCRFRMPECAD
jgi:hypothetical protein